MKEASSAGPNKAKIILVRNKQNDTVLKRKKKNKKKKNEKNFFRNSSRRHRQQEKSRAAAGAGQGPLNYRSMPAEFQLLNERNEDPSRARLTRFLTPGRRRA